MRRKIYISEMGGASYQEKYIGHPLWHTRIFLGLFPKASYWVTIRESPTGGYIWENSFRIKRLPNNETGMLCIKSCRKVFPGLKVRTRYDIKIKEAPHA